MKRLLIPLLLATATLHRRRASVRRRRLPHASRHAGRALPARRPDRRDGAPPGRKLRQPLNQNVIVENWRWRRRQHRLGIWRAPKPDGYTILFGTSGPLAINISLYKNQGYDPRESFAPVIRIGHLPNILVVHPRCPRPTCRR